MEHAYAQALWDMVEKGTTPAQAVHGLRELLARQGRAALLPKVAKAFARIAEREHARRGLTLCVAREQDARSAAASVADVLDELHATEKDFDVQVDTSLIGGWRLEGGGILVDRSYRKQLLDMYNRAVS